ncbi:MAG: L,D-transpeptidase family protein [Firmicutes bacterium]|nr:L,D-transpeptidase family protein [Bacillota bacterium]
MGMKLLTGKTWCWLLVMIILGQTTVLHGEAPESCACDPEPVISPGAVGKDIAELQRFLQTEKLYDREISGVFDHYTAEAVKAFQRRNRLATTGILDFPTWQALGQSAATTVATNPPPGDLRVVVDTRYFTLYVLVDGEVFTSFPVAIGKRETPTPVGNWKVINKGHWSGGFGTRWIGLSIPFGIYGIHGTNKPWSIGRMESKGCIRMYNRDVEQLYRWVKVGTPVHIIGDPFMGRRRLAKGEKGADVMYLQKRLRQLGFYDQGIDGIFGPGTEQAVKTFQQENQFPVTGQVGWREYIAMGLISEE